MSPEEEQAFKKMVEGFQGAGDGTKSPEEMLREALDERDKQAGGNGQKSAATELVETAHELYDFGVSERDEVFALPIDGPKVTATLRGGKKSLRAQLAREFFARRGKTAPQQALADALLVLEGEAQDTEPVRLYERVAEHGGALWVDLGDATGRAIRIDGSGWTVEAEAPVLFRRTGLVSPLPEPEHGGNLAELWDWLNVAEEDRPIIAAWLVAALFPDMPHPVLAFFGQQGSGKSTATKLLVELADPSPAPLRKTPRDADAWVTSASGSWVVALENISAIPLWLSDSICRAVTGDGDIRRRLYSDNDLVVFSFRRCVIVNGIDVGALPGDLADRMAAVNLDAISEADRLEEGPFWEQWGSVRPRVLGALLDLAAGVKKALPYVRLDSKPRMADFARILAAVDELLATTGMARYLGRGGDLAEDTLSGDVLAVRIRETFGTGFPRAYEGPTADLLEQLAPTMDWRPPRDWPRNAREATARLRRLAPAFHKIGWLVEDLGRGGHGHTQCWRIAPPGA